MIIRTYVLEKTIIWNLNEINYDRNGEEGKVDEFNRLNSFDYNAPETEPAKFK